MDTRLHWQNVYQTKLPDEVSWFRPHLDRSIELIQAAAPDLEAAILDVGAGESTLVDDLFALGYRNLTLVDISQKALDVAKTRLGNAGSSVRWICEDITELSLPEHSIDVWHDRALFHFLISPADRVAYVQSVERTLKPGGHVIVCTFGPEGPTKCSGLETMRYDEDSLQQEFGGEFQRIDASRELHKTPSGATQQFLYCHFQRK